MSRRASLFAFLLAITLLAIPGGAFGQRPGGGQPRLVLQALDLDGDGTLSAAEIKAAPQSLLKLDRDEDGQLTADELSPRPENAGASPDDLVKQLMAFDSKGTGFLTRDELPARMQGLFDRADANHDGKLTPEEIRKLANRQAMPTGPASSGGGGQIATRMDPILNALDTNHDGVISAEEIANAAQSLLTLDKNGDGQITADEMRPRQQTLEERVQHMLDENDTDHDGRISRAEAPDFMQKQFDVYDKNHDGYLDKDEITQMQMNQGGGPGGPGGGPGGGPRDGGDQQNNGQRNQNGDQEQNR
jgi:Ca2+-binding EF-hand superfamily protein